MSGITTVNYLQNKTWRPLSVGTHIICSSDFDEHFNSKTKIHFDQIKNASQCWTCSIGMQYSFQPQMVDCAK